MHPMLCFTPVRGKITLFFLYKSTVLIRYWHYLSGKPEDIWMFFHNAELVVGRRRSSGDPGAIYHRLRLVIHELHKNLCGV